MLIPFLVLHQARRDQALGLPRPGGWGQKTLSLEAYYRRRQGEMVDKLAQAAFLKALLGECRAEVGRLIEGADTPDKRREILPQVQRLGELAEQAGQALEAMSHG